MTWSVLHVDLAGQAPAIAEAADRAFVVFWWHALPLGTGTFSADELAAVVADPSSIRARLVARQLAARAAELGAPPRVGGDAEPVLRLTLDAAAAFPGIGTIDALGAPSERAADDVSVVVCTRDRPNDLARCLAALARQRARPLEVVVVDNSASRSAEPVCIGVPGVRYEHEPRPGLSAARNAGVAASRGAIVACTDDDVEPHPGWLAELAWAFAAHPDADAVTGLVLPASLDTAAQRFFQFEMGGFGSSFLPLRFDASFIEEQRPHGPQVWRIGAGANMAFRREALQRAGGFDERLGAGASGCSEDSEMWYRILATGGCCVYEPRAVVLHRHRERWPELLQQARMYMKGHVAALVVQADRHGHRGNLRRVARQLPRYFARTAWSAVLGRSGARLRVLLAEVAGWAGGVPFVFRRAWRRQGSDAGGRA